MKRYLAIFSLIFLTFTVILISCNNSNSKVNDNNPSVATFDSLSLSETHTDTLDNVLSYLLDASANDFYNHQPPVPVEFRNVQIKYYEKRLYIICGEFLALDKQNKVKWIAFATIKTTKYEQWIGVNDSNYCQESKVISYRTSDLSSALKSRFDSLKNLKNKF